MGQHFQRIATGLDVRPLLTALGKRPELWAEITARQDTKGSPHVDTETIFLRWAQNQTLDAVFSELEAVDYPALAELPEAAELIEYVRHAADGKKLGRAMLVNLLPQGLITPHIDEGAYADYYERFHLCLASESKNEFYCEEAPGNFEFVHMRPGDLWWFNHKKKHWVINNSNSSRIHLIVDVVSEKYRVPRDA